MALKYALRIWGPKPAPHEDDNTIKLSRQFEAMGDMDAIEHSIGLLRNNGPEGDWPEGFTAEVLFLRGADTRGPSDQIAILNLGRRGS